MTRRPTVPVSVVIPTIGRPLLLRQCLQSLRECAALPAEVVVVDQSRAADVAVVALEFADINVRMVRSRGRGIGLARNEGVLSARYDVILVTDDDCTVAADWPATGADLVEASPDAILTGRVLPSGNPATVPSTKEDVRPRDFTGALDRTVPFLLRRGELFTGNMACNRRALLDFGGFDERVVPSGEDNDLCYRWLRAGRALRYQPELVVWHHDWRTVEQMREVWVQYAIGEGMFYAKHLRHGDLRMLQYIGADLLSAMRGHAKALLTQQPTEGDWRLGVLRGLPRGLLRGWREFRP